MTKEETLKGLECCADFMCKDCPYRKFSDQTYTIRCMHRLMVDLQKLEAENSVVVKQGSWSLYSSTMMECSECKKHVPYHRYNYCPHCGAKNKRACS
jgi:hypothetical protein